MMKRLLEKGRKAVEAVTGQEYGTVAELYPVAPVCLDYLEKLIPLWQRIYQGNPPWREGPEKKRQLRAGRLLCEFVARYNTAELEVRVGAGPGKEKNGERANRVVGQILKENSFHRKLRELDEWAEALGGGFLKPYNDGGRILIDYIPAGSFYPLGWDNRRFLEGIFTSRYARGETVLTRLEVHRFEPDPAGWGQRRQLVVCNRLFASSNGQGLGREVDLGDYPEFSHLQAETRFDREEPLFSYFRPAVANHHSFEAPFGVSRFGGAVDTLEEIDDAYHAWSRERKKTVTRLWVTGFMVEQGEGQGPRFDEDEDIYEIFNAIGMEDQTPQAFSPRYGVEQRIADLDAQLNILCGQAGLSSGAITFRSDTASKATATQVVYEGDSTFATIGANQKDELGPAIEQLVEGILFLAAHPAIGLVEPEDYEVKVRLNDGIRPTFERRVEQMLALRDKGLCSRYRALTETLEMTDGEARQEIARILEEREAGCDAMA